MDRYTREKRRVFLKCAPPAAHVQHKCAENVAWLARDEDDIRLLADALGLEETAVCPSCGKVYFAKDGHECESR